MKTSVKVINLKKRPQPEQKSKEWFDQRLTQITASNVASCIPFKKEYIQEYMEEFPNCNIKEKDFKNDKYCNPYENADSYIKKMVNNFYNPGVSNYKDTKYTIWGKKYEAVACNFYSKLKNVIIHEFGLITHKQYKWLAASPDGITNNGVMLEIKCPLSRKINGIPNLYYWCQVMIQLEVCNLDECDFLECEIVEISLDEYNSKLNSNNSSDNNELLKIGYVLTNNKCTSENEKYIYSFENSKINELKDHDLLNYSINYYYIHKFNIITIKRSTNWFKKIKPILYSIYKQIKYIQSDKKYFLDYINDKMPTDNLIIDFPDTEYTHFIQNFNESENEIQNEEVEDDNCLISV